MATRSLSALPSWQPSLAWCCPVSSCVPCTRPPPPPPWPGTGLCLQPDVCSGARGTAQQLPPFASLPCAPLSTPWLLPTPTPCAVSFFERAGNAHFNALVVADADGSIIGHYRKSHIPDGPGCEHALEGGPGAGLGGSGGAVLGPAGLRTATQGRPAGARAACAPTFPPPPPPTPAPPFYDGWYADQEKFYFSPGDTGFKVFKTRFADIGVLICWDQVPRSSGVPWSYGG